MLASLFMQLQESDAPIEKDQTDLTFDPLRAINSSKYSTFFTFIQDANKERNDVLCTSFQKKKYENMLTSGGWSYNTISDSIQLSYLF